ncbi:hypothetical protein KIN20_021097 [Parelaphostrongylus tenuis]|uniref:Uncharacterized protein n=1 Tax=Parelaphostrongylus tenuis TaxID=148309 RepID=A0AAD5N4V4_PARTN|nr:hypothetical protein KIN20_021097 [Parelaphostrongylus tenuis]
MIYEVQGHHWRLQILPSRLLVELRLRKLTMGLSDWIGLNTRFVMQQKHELTLKTRKEFWALPTNT